MATQLDRKTALVVIDMQKGIVGLPIAHPAADIVAQVAKLTRAFREKGLPVVLVNVTGGAPGRTDAGPRALPPATDWAEFIPELDRQPGDHIVTKLQWGAFHGTSLDQYLRRHGITQIVLAGIATSIGVESTARNAYEFGYNVALVVDAMTDMSADAHRNSVEIIFPRLGERVTTDEVLGLLKQQG
ncbi:MAG TPA: isochorismatase family protein [Luteibacter sp.]|jgi:nicotinamidase-related amidase|nr:isochorismatase family protein [Luteibacter sp.]